MYIDEIFLPCSFLPKPLAVQEGQYPFLALDEGESSPHNLHSIHLVEDDGKDLSIVYKMFSNFFIVLKSLSKNLPASWYVLNTGLDFTENILL